MWIDSVGREGKSRNTQDSSFLLRLPLAPWENNPWWKGNVWWLSVLSIQSPECLGLLSRRVTSSILLFSTATTVTRGPSGGWGTGCPWLTSWWGSACSAIAWWSSLERKYDHLIYRLVIFFTHTAHSHGHSAYLTSCVGEFREKTRKQSKCRLSKVVYKT